MLKKMATAYRKNKQLRTLSALSAMLVVAIVGTYLLTGSHAASPFASLNADQGTLGCGASSGSDSTASDGQKVTFGTCNGGGGTSPSCTVNLTPAQGSTVTINSTTQGVTNGSVVCIPHGTYSSLSVSGGFSSNVTVEPDPSQDPNGAGKVTFGGINVTGTYITVHNFYSTKGINFLPGSSASSLCPTSSPAIATCHDTADHNDVTNSPGGYGIDVSCNTTSVNPYICGYITISGNNVHGTYNTSGDGDALRLDGWTNVTISGNEEYNDNDVNGATGHMDCLQSYTPTSTPANLVFYHNYVHDSNCEILIQEEAGNGSNYQIIDNLLANISPAACQNPGNTGADTTCASFAGSSTNIDTVATPITFRNNTYVNTNGSDVNGNGSSTVYVDHNVFDQFNVAPVPSAMTESNNAFTAANEWSFSIASNDLPASCAGKNCFTSYSPPFKNTATEDYELTSLPSEGCMPTPLTSAPNASEPSSCIGIDWNPNNQHYGPLQ